MTNPAAKRLTLVAAVVAVAIISVAVFAQFGGRTISPVESSTTLPSSAASSTQTRLTSTPSSSGMTSLSIGFSQSNPELVSTPSITMNYTLVINQLNTSSTANQVALSATSTVPGVTLSISPNQFTFLGTQEAVLFEISVAPAVNSSILPVEITARTANGATSSTFDFRLDKALVVVTGTGLTPPTLHVNVGQAVNWLDLVEVDDDGNGYANITLKDGSAASPTMGLYDAWSHKFDKPGTYTYQVTVYSHTLSGLVVVA